MLTFKFFILRCFTFLFLFTIPLSVFAENQEIEGDGTGKIFAGDVSRAREEAIRDALKNVIKNASAFLMGAELYQAKSREVAKRVLAAPKRYINWHGIVSENTTTKEVSVRVRASVSLDKLRTDLSSLLEPVSKPETKTAKKVLLLGAPIAPEEFTLDPAQRTPAPEAKAAFDTVQRVLQLAGYEVLLGGAIGPSDDAAAIAARAKADDATLALVLSPIGGPVGEVSISSLHCAEIKLRLFLYDTDGTDGGTLSSQGMSCDILEEKASEKAVDQASTYLGVLIGKDPRFSSSSRRRLHVKAIPSFSALELVTKSLKDVGGTGVELLGVEGGNAVFLIPSDAPKDTATRVASVLGNYRASAQTIDGIPLIELTHTRIFVEGVENEKALSFLTQTLSEISGVSEISASSVKQDGSAEIWLWGGGRVEEIASAISATTLLGRTLKAEQRLEGGIRLIVGPSRLGGDFQE